MKLIVTYLFLVLAALTAFTYMLISETVTVHEKLELPIVCALCGAFGGVVYCMRGVYLNASVKKQWDKSWHIWYLLRPTVSAMAGGASFIFLKAGLLVLDTTEGDSSIYGFLALAFVSGLNVDKFIAKIEDVAQSTFGIEKSRSAEIKDQDK